VANTPIYNTLTWGNIAVFSVGISAALFIAASQLFLRAKDSDTWNLPERYEQSLRNRFEAEGKDWGKIKGRKP